MNIVYALIDPLSKEARYIGLTSQPLDKRLAGHLGYMASKPVSIWIDHLSSFGMKPEIVAIETIPTREVAIEAEAFWIGYLSALGAKLLNVFTYRRRNETGHLRLPMSLVDMVNQSAADRDMPVAEVLTAALRALEEKEAHRDRELRSP